MRTNRIAWTIVFAVCAQLQSEEPSWVKKRSWKEKSSLREPSNLLPICEHLEPPPPPPPPAMVRVDFRHIEAGGIGYNQGYSTIALFSALKDPLWQPRLYPFVDLRGHIFNDGRLAANAGIGLRYLRNDFAYGINGYYDYRNKHHFYSNQVGMGLEFFSNRWAVRANGYIPIGKTASNSWGQPLFDHFSGHYMYIKRKQLYTFAGADAEASGNLANFRGWNLLGGAGPYYLYGKTNHQNVYGGKGRLRASYQRAFFLELSGSYDNFFHGQIQGEAGFSIHFGPKAYRKKEQIHSVNYEPPLCTMEWQRALAPHRSEIIPFGNFSSQTVAINPLTGQPFYFIFVDNTSHSQGTFESPFSNLAAAQAAASPYNVIYVYPGDGTTNGLTSGFVMKTGQQLLGTAFSYTFNTTVGPVLVPNLSTTSPNLAATDALAVTIANDCTVSGLTITSTITSAGQFIAAIANVAATPSTANATVSNPTVTNNTIIQTQTNAGVIAYGIRLANPTGVATVSNNQITTTATGSTNHRLIQIDPFGTSPTITVANNNITFSGASGAYYGVRVTTSGGIQTISILNNTVTMNSSGIQGNLAATLANSGQATVLVQGNTVSGATTNIADGILLYSPSSSTLTAQILSNSVACNYQSTFGGGIHTQTQSSGTLTSLIQNNTTSLGLFGVYIDDQSGSQTARVLNNTSSSNTDAIFAQTSDTASLCLRYQNNTATPSTSLITLTSGAGTTFNLEPLTGNTGTPIESGNINNVSQNFCGN